MSIAEPPAIRKPQPLQKWWMLYPANWVDLAFDRNWRAKRLVRLAASQSYYYFIIWFFLGSIALSRLLFAAEEYFNLATGTDSESRYSMLSISNDMVFWCLLCFLFFLFNKFEQLLLQVIDRLEVQGVSHD